MGRTRRVSTALLAVVCALLVMTAPVAADHTIVLASQHTTASDFNTAAELTNVSVSGSGSSSSVVLNNSDRIDSFEDGDLVEYSGATGDWVATISGGQTDGDFRLEPVNSNGGVIISTPGDGLPRYYNRDDDGEYAVDVLPLGDGIKIYALAVDSDNAQALKINPNDIQYRAIEGGIETTRETVTVDVPTEWLTVTVNNTAGSVIVWEVREEDSGTLVARIDTNIPNTDSNIGDGIGFASNGTNVRADFARVVGTDLSGRYVGDNHTVAAGTSGYTNLSLTDASATVVWEGTNGSTWTQVASATYTTSGNRTQSFSGTYDTYRANVTFAGVAGDSSAELHSEGVFATNREPVLSNLSPADDASVSGGSVTLEADVADLNMQQGESVEVNFTVNGSVVDSQTINSNQTVSTIVSIGGGEHTWSVQAEDSSHTVDTATRSFTTPGVIRVYDGDSPTSLLTRDLAVEFVGTSSDSNYQSTTTVSDGTVELGGLPNEELRVRLNNSSYAERVLIIDNPSQTRQTVMYNLSAASTFEQCFQLDSRGAGFAPDETTLTVQAYLNGQWRDAGGKYFGAANLACFSLQDGEDYRLAVSDGDQTRNLGGYEADQSFEAEVITLVVEGVTFGLDRGEDYRWQATIDNSTGSPQIVFKLDSQDQNLEDLEIEIWERGTPSNVLDSLTTTGDVGVYTASFPLTNAEANQEWVLNWTAEYPDGEVVTGQAIVSLPGPASTIIPSGIPDEALLGLMVGLVILLAMVFSQLHAGVGMVITVSFAGLLVLLGVLSVPTNVLMLAIALSVVGYLGLGVFR